MQHIKWSLLLILLVLACSKRNPKVNRVVDNVYDKAQFNPDWESGNLSPEWYYRMTVVDAPPASQALSIAEGTWLHPETIRFDITEKYLVGWRAHSSVPGSEGELSAGGKEVYRGAPIVAFKILSHLDVGQSYDPVTSSKGNLIIENTSDRSWYKRRFMKIDFSQNVVEDLKRSDETYSFWSSDKIDRDNAFAIDQNEPSNPKRSRFEDGYFEVTTRQGVKVDILQYYGEYGEPFQMDEAAPVFDIRYSFMKKPQSSNYKPLNYEDDFFDQFGFYRTSFYGQQKWDNQRGSLEKNKNKNVTRFNIWNENGSPKPIIYYTSVTHPRSLLNASRRVESEWNKVFRELVFQMKRGDYKTIDEVPNMWILRENDCRLANLEGLLNGDLKSQVEELSKQNLDDIRKRIALANDMSSNKSFSESNQIETAALEDLERMCAALEYATKNAKTPFRYQRSGDLRYNLMNIISKRVHTNWSGLGPMFADMETGEIIQSQANVNLWYIDRRAQQASDLIDMMMGKVKFKDLVLGSDVQRHVAQTIGKIKRDENLLPSDIATQKINHHLAKQTVDRMSSEEINSRLDVLNGTSLMSKLYIEKMNPLKDYFAKEARLHKQAMTVSDPPEFVDNLAVGMAFQYKNESPKARFMKIRESIYMATMLHEVGHNMGLTHNMSGSADPLNYNADFWRGQKLPAKLTEALSVARLVLDQDSPLIKTLLSCAKDSQTAFGGLISTQDCLRQPEFMYSSIMDYLPSWNADLAGLGSYDKAAIFFGYGQLVERFGKGLLSNEAKKDTKRWLFLNDWRKIPREFVSSEDAINKREWVKYERGAQIADRVPYRFCIDSSGTFDSTCRAFDFGADMRGRAARNRTDYWSHYYLTHFARNRIWNLDTDMSNVISRDLSIFEDFNQIMRWYGYYSLTYPGFKESDAGKDYLAAVVTGLNHYSHVLGHPVSGDHLTTHEKPGVMQSVDELDDCALENVTLESPNKELKAVPGHSYGTVFLGDGRPFSFGLNNDYEEYHLSYVGSFYAKMYATYFLSTPAGSVFPRTDNLKDNRLFKMSWYRLFPAEVSDIFSKLIRSEWESLGPVMTPDGDLVHRNILEVGSLKKTDYAGLTPVMPAVGNVLSYRALFYESALLSVRQGNEENPIHSLRIGMTGDSDDIRGDYVTSDSPRVTFVHPVSGHSYWAIKSGYSPTAYDYIKKLNQIKNELGVFEKCSSDAEFRKKEQSCKCLVRSVDGECCSVSNPKCKEPFYEECSARELKLKVDDKRVELENAVGFVDDIRKFYHRYTSLN